MDLHKAILDKEMDGNALLKCAEAQVNSFARQTEILNLILFDKETEEEFQRMSVAFTKMLADCYMHNLYDGRNETACQIAKRIVDSDAFYEVTYKDEVVPCTQMLYQYEFEKAMKMCKEPTDKKELKEKRKLALVNRVSGFAYYARIYMHRTLQQSFASLAFECIDRMLNGRLGKELGISDWELPMI